MDDAAQSPKTQNGQLQDIPSSAGSTGGISVLPHKEHAPIADALKEHVKPSDPIETQPEIQAELKEHGIEARQDEAKLELTRSHHQVGMSHPPAGQTVTDHIKDEKQEFPMTFEEAKEKRKGSSKLSFTWLAEEILKAMKGPKIS